MNGIAIHDLKDGVLAFDLEEILTAIGEAAQSSEWRVRPDRFWYIADEDVHLFDAPREPASWATGAAFASAVRQVRQIVDGVFEGRRPGRISALARRAGHRQLLVGGLFQ